MLHALHLQERVPRESRRSWLFALGSVCLGAAAVFGPVEPVLGFTLGPTAALLAVLALRARQQTATAAAAAAGLALALYAIAGTIAVELWGSGSSPPRPTSVLEAKSRAPAPSAASPPLRAVPYGTRNSPSATNAAPEGDQGSGLERASWLFAIGGPLVGAAGGLGGAIFSRRQRHQLEYDAFRRDAATALVPVESLLVELAPSSSRPDGVERTTLKRLRGRWSETVRGQLLIFASVHGDTDFGARARALEEQVSRCFVQVSGAATAPGCIEALEEVRSLLADIHSARGRSR